MVQHLPPDELLLDYAAGKLPQPLSLLVATHLTLAPESRRRVRTFEELGGALLDSVEPAGLAEDALDKVMARLDAPEAGAAPVAGSGLVERSGGPRGDPRQVRVPAPLCAHLRDGLDSVPWHRRGPHVAEHDLLSNYPGYRTRLLRIDAGVPIPEHTHEGTEYTLVLEGSYSDETGNYARGDISVADPEVTHRPVAGGERDCICLAVTDAPLKMTGPLGRILNWFVDM